MLFSTHFSHRTSEEIKIKKTTDEDAVKTKCTFNNNTIIINRNIIKAERVKKYEESFSFITSCRQKLITAINSFQNKK